LGSANAINKILHPGLDPEVCSSCTAPIISQPALNDRQKVFPISVREPLLDVY
jgi:hypothetical protein